VRTRFHSHESEHIHGEDPGFSHDVVPDPSKRCGSGRPKPLFLFVELHTFV
jgi:hypothetical protein